MKNAKSQHQPVYTDCRNCGTADHADYRCPCACHSAKSKGNHCPSISGEIRTDERHRQERAAAVYCSTVYRYHFVCSDNTTFSAIASSQAGAHLVLSLERPGVEARFVDRTHVPMPPRERRIWGDTPVLLLATPACAQCRNLFASDDGSHLCGRCRWLQACNRQHVEGRA